MIDDAHTTDSDLAGTPVLAALRDDIARVLHDWDHGKQENDSPTDPCWHAWRVEAELLLPAIRGYLSAAWEEGVRDGVATPNPYRHHAPHACTCAFHYAAAMGGGR